MVKNNKVVIIMAIITATILSLFYKMQYYPIVGNEAHRFLIVIYGGFVSSDGLNFLQALAFCIPFLIQLLLFVDTINKEFNIATSYIFPRKNTRTKWLLVKFKDIFIYSTYFYILQFATVLGLSLLFTYHFDLINIVFVAFLLLITLVSINTLLVMIAAIFCIGNKTSIIFSFSFAGYFAWIFLLPFIKKISLLFEYMPFSHALLLYHNLPVHIFSIQEISYKSGMPLWHTIVYGVIGIGLLTIIGPLWLKKINIMEGSK